jgi:hypothetical protein
MAALFIGWGPAIAGQELQGLKVFNEGVEYWTRLQQSGEIESFEPVLLEPHGGDLAGFVLVRGDRDKLNRLRYSDEWLRLNNRATMVVQSLGIVTAFVGDEVAAQMRDYQAQATDLGRR